MLIVFGRDGVTAQCGIWWGRHLGVGAGIVWHGGFCLVGWWVLGWCSSWCSAAVPEEPLDEFSNRLHRAEQKVSFKGGAIGGTVGVGVAGWGFSSCRATGAKRYKLVKAKSEKIGSRLSSQPFDHFTSRLDSR